MFDFDDDDINIIKPLADRMRPNSLDEMYGQEHILSVGKPLRTMIEHDRITSLVFYGPPGTGKSSLASIIAQKTKSYYISINAVLSNIADIRDSIKKAEGNAKRGKKTILFIDEIHRFNKSQQDALLPAIEKGTIILIASTTHNPYFYLNNALLSRVMLFEFKAIVDSDVKNALINTISSERGLGDEGIKIDESSINLIVKSSIGDIRKAITYLEMSFLSVELDDDNDSLEITEDIVKEVTTKKGMMFDRDGDEHYNVISAFIKSVRGSDANAALYYLARMLESGEDPRFIVRRLTILAVEDIGLANTNAMNVVSSLINIIEFIGMPEGRIALSEATIYLALSPKSNSAYLAIDAALKDVRDGEILNVPNYLKDTHSGSYDVHASEEYKYPHDYPYHIVEQDYLDNASHKLYYESVDIGDERELKKRYEWIVKHLYAE